jgi:2-oxoglutarate dehydrogenase E2 component (dihydrolipoamide succinyltransferase)
MNTLEVKIPAVGESITEVTIAQWMKKDGDIVKEDEPICEIESDKATVELSSPGSGQLKILTLAGQSVKIGTVVATVTAMAADTVGHPSKDDIKLEVLKAEIHEIKPPIASPSAEKYLREQGIDSSTLKGTGKEGRITKEDVLSAGEREHEAEVVPIEPSKSLVIMHGAREVKKEKMSTLRKTIAKRLLYAKNQTAMLTTFNEINMYEVMSLRKKYKDAFKEKYDIGLGLMSFFTKAVCLALEKYPIINAQVDGEEILYHHYADIGVAVSTPKGLVVPVIRNAELLSLAAIEKSIGALALKAKESKLTMDEMSGGTFTITNGGVFGSMLSTPILNSPQSAILGMHNIVDRPWVVEGEIKIRPIMYVALSYDHRIIDGKDSVSFLKTVKELIEDPSRLLLDI